MLVRRINSHQGAQCIPEVSLQKQKPALGFCYHIQQLKDNVPMVTSLAL